MKANPSEIFNARILRAWVATQKDAQRADIPQCKDGDLLVQMEKDGRVIVENWGHFPNK